MKKRKFESQAEQMKTPSESPAVKEGFWRGVGQNAIGGVIAGLLMLALAKPWAEKKIGDVTAKIEGTQNQVNAISGQVGQLNQNVKNLKQTVYPHNHATFFS